jgi:parallel beta-helix repeat protein
MVGLPSAPTCKEGGLLIRRTLLLVSTIALTLVVAGGMALAASPSWTVDSGVTVVSVNPGDDLDAKANAAPAGAAIQVHGKAGGPTYSYAVDRSISLKAGQTLIGDAGTTSMVGSAVVPAPVVGIEAAKSARLTTLIKADGDPIRVAWLDLDATYSQKSISGINGGPNLTMDHVRVHGAQASGIGQYRGSVFDSEIVGNGTNPKQFDGTVSGIKCNYACEVARSYVHDNPGNGIWCDVGCVSEPGMANGFWVHENVAADNGRHGIFYENAPKPSINWGKYVSALMESNYVYGNANSGISVSDTDNATVRNNVLGKTVGGVIDHNAYNEGIELHSSGETSRGIQQNAVIVDNQMNGETIEGTGTDRDGTPNTGCGDNGNVCTNNN